MLYCQYLYYHHLREIQSVLIKESTSSDAFISSVATEMLEKFSEYWKHMHLVLEIAVVMDPRFKMKYIEFCSSKLEGSDSEANSVIEKIRAVYNKYVIKFPREENFVSDSSSSESEYEDEEEEAEETKPVVDFELLSEYKQLVQSNSRSVKSDLDLYLEEPVLPWRDDFNVLSWWRTASPRYPILSRVARDFLAIPISIATSYEAFYTEPREVEERIVSAAGPEMINVLMCTRTWSGMMNNS